jgi:hypothetical protein
MSDLRYALRQLWKSPAFSLIAIATLALGIGANTAIFSVIESALLRPLPFPNADRLVRVYETFDEKGKPGNSLNLAEKTVRQWREFGSDVSIKEATDSIEAKAEGGSVAAYISKQPRSDSKLTAEAGNVDLRLPESIAVNVDASCSAGRLSSDFGPTFRIIC